VRLPSGNRIIDALQEHAASPLLERATVETLAREEWTTRENHVMQTVDFPVSALLSVVARLEDGSTAEVASVGNDGFVEIDAALRNRVAKRSSICLFPGDVIRLRVADFQHALRESSVFSDHVYHAVRGRVFITEQLAACGLRHDTGKRLARWLLLVSEQINSDVIFQTHEQLGAALGVRRASVTVEASQLQAIGAISYRRGLVKIENREALAERSCECYRLCHRALGETFEPPAPL
jgi:hypothetical protein